MDILEPKFLQQKRTSRRRPFQQNIGRCHYLVCLHASPHDEVFRQIKKEKAYFR